MSASQVTWIDVFHKWSDVTPMERPTQVFRYSVVKCRGKLNLLSRAKARVNVRRDIPCHITTVVHEPFQRNRAIITVEGENLNDLLSRYDVKGNVRVEAYVYGGGRIRLHHPDDPLTHVPVNLTLRFSDKRAAVMFKLTYGGV